MLSQRPLCSIFHCGEALRLAGHVTKIRNSVLLILAAWNEGVGDLLNWYPEWSSKERSVFNACVRLDFSHLNTLLLLHCVFPTTVFLHYLASVDSAIARCGDMGKMVFFKSLPFLVNKRIIGTIFWLKKTLKMIEANDLMCTFLTSFWGICDISCLHALMIRKSRSPKIPLLIIVHVYVGLCILFIKWL